MVRREFFKEFTGRHRLSCNSWDDLDGASVSAAGGILAVAAVMLYSVLLLVVGISGIVIMLCECGGDKKLLLVIVFDIMFQVVIYNKIMAAYTHL